MTRGSHLDSLAQRIEPKATWDDVALPPRVLAQLRQIADRIGEGRPADPAPGRGPGLGVLFSGTDAPAKLRAAEAIANHLGLAVYRVDLAAVVSKYIGETEKNLDRVFDAADGAGAILFFDEADALFGKRSEVKDSHDRYADIELNYLLQRIESRAGLTILAASAGTPLPRALKRQLCFVVNFPLERKRRTVGKAPHISTAVGGPKPGIEYTNLSALQEMDDLELHYADEAPQMILPADWGA